jgi:hypothetical protein
MKLKQINNDSKESDFFAYLKYAHSVIKNTQPILWTKSTKYNDVFYKNARLLVSQEQLEKFYFEAKNIYNCVLDGVDFNYFVKLMSYGKPEKDYYKKKKYYQFYDYHRCEHREKISFVKNESDADKKEKSKNQEWREFKKIKKDKSKKHYRRSPDAHFRQLNHQAYRAKIRQLIKHERFDDVFEKLEKIYLNPWDWD